MNSLEIKQKIRAFIASHVVESGDNFDLTDDAMIFELGFLDSMFALQLVNFIEDEFDIDVTDEDLDLFNFSSINNAFAFIIRKKEGP
jgi:acyl carrier protein